jgi:hypothetical protein
MAIAALPWLRDSIALIAQTAATGKRQQVMLRAIASEEWHADDADFTAAFADRLFSYRRESAK